MLASRVLITAGTPGHMYLDDRQAKWLWTHTQYYNYSIFILTRTNRYELMLTGVYVCSSATVL